MMFYPLALVILLCSCGLVPEQQKKSHHSPDILDKQTSRHPAVQLKFIDSGLDKSKRRFDIYAEVLRREPGGQIQKAEIFIENKFATGVSLVHEKGSTYVKDKVMFKLKIHNTKIRIYMSDFGYRDFPLECTRPGYCL